MDTQKVARLLPPFLLSPARRAYCLYQKLNSFCIGKREVFFGHRAKPRPQVLVYGVSALSFGGTEKNLQLIAKYLDKSKYDVHFMYGTKPRKLGGYNERMIEERLSYVKGGAHINLIPFTYDVLEETHPYLVRGMFPRIQDVIRAYDIDVVVLAGAGNAEFPLTEISVPMVFLNIFGIPNTVAGIRTHVCVSHAVEGMIADIVPGNRRATLYNPSEGAPDSAMVRGKELRHEWGVSDSDVLFGRIGRADDSIFDPIGIRAFQKVVAKYPNVHYCVVSPAPKLVEIVRAENIPNVHLLDPIYREDEVWAFHSAIDVLAHFRYDGESCGVNIIESMLCGKPIITHRSTIWNAHLEYLDAGNSFVADVGDVGAYASFLEKFAAPGGKDLAVAMGASARERASDLFLARNYMARFNAILESALCSR